MVVDHIRNRALYYGLGEDFRAALDFLAQYRDDVPVTEDRKISGGAVTVRIRPVTTKPQGECAFEAHRYFADIHYVAAGLEGISYADVENLHTVRYDEASDAALLTGEGDVLVLREGYFMITMPDDAHMPCIAVGEPCRLVKLIAKIKVK